MSQASSGDRSRHTPDFGAFVCSLDFELRWGLRERHPQDGGRYRQNLVGVRSAVPKMLALFEKKRIHATWATVGALMARDPDEFASHLPSVRPNYDDSRLSPYGEAFTLGAADLALHFAEDLVLAVRNAPGQEIGTHTFSHYYCLESGQTREAFAADLQSAHAIAATKGIQLRSLVMPRNQFNEAYRDVIKASGLIAYRGNPDAWAYRAKSTQDDAAPARRLTRLADAYLPVTGDHLHRWHEVMDSDGLCNVPASAFLRPWSRRLARLEPLRIIRLRRAIRNAAKQRAIFHLWWHPHNFGVDQDENLRVLAAALDEVERCRREFGMRSLSMGEVADAALS